MKIHAHIVSNYVLKGKFHFLTWPLHKIVCIFIFKGNFVMLHPNLVNAKCLIACMEMLQQYNCIPVGMSIKQSLPSNAALIAASWFCLNSLNPNTVVKIFIISLQWSKLKWSNILFSSSLFFCALFCTLMGGAAERIIICIFIPFIIIHYFLKGDNLILRTQVTTAKWVSSFF